MEEYILYEVPVAGERQRSPKNKQVAVDENDGIVAGVPDWRQGFFSGSGSGEVYGSVAIIHGGLHMMDEALRVSDLEVDTARFRAEQAEKEVSRLKSEAEACSLCESDLASRQASAIPCARMNGSGTWP
ncbi:hypothetical protein F2Q68_00034864 [Brassica cretica]|uniref:Uncharacterized protein n=1 Tax=Brassica cretica TaxID=69181 RepID=A0A8S9H4M1_BRACR|nr:hypothetical protein F2Q68_00034864 [Brassica cretica]